MLDGMNAHAAWPVVHTDTAAVAAPPAAALTLLLPSGARLPLGERCAIGLSPENDVVLADPSIEPGTRVRARLRAPPAS